MHIVQDEIFKKNHLKIVEFIAEDSKRKAKNFNGSLLNKINQLLNMPYKFRQSYHYDDSNIRDLIFKGYTIPYLIDSENEIIVVLDIFKWSKK